MATKQNPMSQWYHCSFDGQMFLKIHYKFSGQIIYCEQNDPSRKAQLYFLEAKFNHPYDFYLSQNSKQSFVFCSSSRCECRKRIALMFEEREAIDQGSKIMVYIKYFHSSLTDSLSYYYSHLKTEGHFCSTIYFSIPFHSFFSVCSLGF